MNDVYIPDRDDVIDPVNRGTPIPSMPRPLARRRRGGRTLALGALLLLALGLSLGSLEHYSQRQQVLATTAQQRDFVPVVRVATVEASPGTVSITLPGTTAAFAAATIFARATGYVVKRNVDIGDPIKAGELLAQLAVPELDDQISQNEATLGQLKSSLEQAQATLVFAQQQASRYQELARTEVGTVEHAQQYNSQLQQQEAAVSAARNSITAQENLVKQLHQNREYASVVAPFDGVITRRNVDVGTLVQGNATSGTFMFEIMQEDVIRVYAHVPQDAAFGVAPGIQAVVRVPELPDRAFDGTVTRAANALQSGTRTLLTEIDIPNPDGALLPGIYCSVEFQIPRKTPSLSVPADAIIFNGDGMQVAVVASGKAELRKVNVTRDLGTRVEVDSGIKVGDQVILNPPVNLVDGSKVQIDSNNVAAVRSPAPLVPPRDVHKKG